MATLVRLATVEVQLIMHHCDTSDLLALARCCRHILAAASHAFAWRGDKSLVQVRMRQPSTDEKQPARRWWKKSTPQVDQLTLCIRSPLLRHAPLGVHFLLQHGKWQERWTVLEPLLRVHHVRELSVHMPLACTLCCQPDATLAMHWSDEGNGKQTILPIEHWNILLSSPALAGLTSLTTSDTGVTQHADGNKQPLLQCRSLRRLALLELGVVDELDQPSLLTTLAQPELAGLGELELAGATFHLDLRPILANLSKLQSLTLRCEYLSDDSLHELLKALSMPIPLLLLLELNLLSCVWIDLVPSADLLGTLLLEQPQHRIILREPTLALQGRYNQAAWEDTMRRWAELAQQQPRFTLVRAKQASEEASSGKGCCVQ